MVEENSLGPERFPAPGAPGSLGRPGQPWGSNELWKPLWTWEVSREGVFRFPEENFLSYFGRPRQLMRRVLTNWVLSVNLS